MSYFLIKSLSFPVPTIDTKEPKNLFRRFQLTNEILHCEKELEKKVIE